MKKLILLLFLLPLFVTAQIQMSQVSGLIPKLNSKQDSITRGTGFLKRVGLAWSYDPSIYLTTETDPTIYSWAKASTKPNYSWSEIASKPTLLSQFTNDLGNYGGWITGINSSMVTTALGFTPYNSTNPSGYISSYSETDPLFIASQAHNITSTDITHLSNLSGSNTGDETATTIKSKLGITTLSGSNTGDNAVNSLYSGLVSFPGFGTSHLTSAYGDHLHPGVYQPIEDQRLSTSSSPIFSILNSNTQGVYGSSYSSIILGTPFVGKTNNGLTPSTNNYYPLITASSTVTGGYINQPSFGYFRNTSMNGDVAISNRGDGLSPIYWLFKPNGDLTIQGSFNGSGSGLTGVEVPLSFSTGLTRSGNTITNNITQYTDAMARLAQTNSSIITALGYTPLSNATSFRTVNSVSVVGIGDISINPFPGFGTGTGAAWGYSAHPTTTDGYGLPNYPTFGTSSLSTNYLPKWNGSSFVNSLISDNGTNIGNVTPLYKFHLRTSTDGNIGFRNPTDFNSSWTVGAAIGCFNNADNANEPLYIESSSLGLNRTSGSPIIAGGGITAPSFSGSASNLTNLPINLTTSGTSGAATYIQATNTLNVPNYGSSSTNATTYTPTATIVSGLTSISATGMYYTTCGAKHVYVNVNMNASSPGLSIFNITVPALSYGAFANVIESSSNTTSTLEWTWINSTTIRITIDLIGDNNYMMMQLVTN